MLFLSEEKIRELADVDEVIRAIRAAFTRDFSASLRMPVRSSLPLEDGGVCLLMPAFDSVLGYARPRYHWHLPTRLKYMY